MFNIAVLTLLAVALAMLVALLVRRASPEAPGLEALAARLERGLERLERLQREELARSRDELSRALHQVRTELQTALHALGQENTAALEAVGHGVRGSLGELREAEERRAAALAERVERLVESSQQKLDAVRQSVGEGLAALQKDNLAQLERLRATVDEQLQGTLERRLGESFKQVSERLEQVHQGLGEMQALATGVGDLKKVLSNVKTRGTWGEVQLGMLLEQVLTREQYSQNVSTKDGGERVEFAVRLPGQEDPDDLVLLPIDAKFPIEDYQRLLEAQDVGDAAAVETASKHLESAVRKCGRDISDKYLNPPVTTDFGILFLPVEGLFAEVVRRPEVTESLRRDHHVVVAGPTTLWAILSSLQMGFRTLAIQKRSSEVWALLSAVKTEWGRYGDLLEKVQKKLGEATTSIDEVQRRSRAIGKKLKDVQTLPEGATSAALPGGGLGGANADGS
jgi:DNA recombination protein RmuC